MTPGARRASLAAALALWAALPGAPPRAEPAAGPEAFEVQEVAPGVFVHPGRIVDIDHPARGDMANLGFVVGEACVAVIDTGGSPATGEALRAAIRARTALPICYVVNTHVHFDHLLGNAAFLAEGARFVGHANLPEAIATNREFFLENFRAELGPEATVESIRGPDITVEGTWELDLGGRVLKLLAHQPAHTNADLTVYDEATGTFFTGDLLFMVRVPVFDASLKGWVSEMETLHGIRATRVVPGHGPASADWPGALEAQERYLRGLLAETRQALLEGWFVDEAMRRVGAAEQPNWQLFEHNHERNVSRAYKELEWE